MGDIPESMPSDGTLKVSFVPVFDHLVATLNGVTSVDLSCYLTQDGFDPSTEEATVVDSRLCSKQDFEQPGRVTESLMLMYVFNTIDEDEDEARQTLQRGTAGNLVVRWGLDFDTTYAIGQEVDNYPIKAGVQRKQKPEQNSVHKIQQKAFITGEVQRDVVLTTI